MPSVNERLDDFVDFTKSGFIWLLGAISVLPPPPKTMSLPRIWHSSTPWMKTKLSSKKKTIVERGLLAAASHLRSLLQFRYRERGFRTKFPRGQRHDENSMTEFVKTRGGLKQVPERWIERKKTSQASQRSLVFLANQWNGSRWRREREEKLVLFGELITTSRVRR
jgi:hypothetical protein